MTSFEVSWRVIRPARLALLDREFVTVAARWPVVMQTIMVRAIGRSHALALSVAINNLQHVELRSLVLFWHLADRFGRVTTEGTLVPITLTHSDIAELIGARVRRFPRVWPGSRCATSCSDAPTAPGSCPANHPRSSEIYERKLSHSGTPPQRAGLTPMRGPNHLSNLGTWLPISDQDSQPNSR